MGKERRVFFFNPLLATEGGGRGAGGAGVWDDKRRSQAQRATATRPRTQIRAQRSAASMTMKSGSTEAGGCGGDPVVVAEEFMSAFRSLKGRVMLARWIESSSVSFLFRECVLERKRQGECCVLSCLEGLGVFIGKE